LVYLIFEALLDEVGDFILLLEHLLCLDLITLGIRSGLYPSLGVGLAKLYFDSAIGDRWLLPVSNLVHYRLLGESFLSFSSTCLLFHSSISL